MALKSMVRFSFIAAIAAALLGQIQALEAGTSSDAAVRDDFLGLCADCHGADGRGNGPLTKNLTKFPPDLTRIKLRANGKFDEKAVFGWTSPQYAEFSRYSRNADLGRLANR